MSIPFFPPDLFDVEELLDLVHEVGTAPEQRFILGARTAEFESAMRESLGVADAIACGSGTSALTLLLHALDVGPATRSSSPPTAARRWPPRPCCAARPRCSPTWTRGRWSWTRSRWRSWSPAAPR
nr:hypothetical protein GCM10017745_54840 [Saccharothrix mutabilis subsp. capreolus]